MKSELSLRKLTAGILLLIFAVFVSWDSSTVYRVGMQYQIQQVVGISIWGFGLSFASLIFGIVFTATANRETTKKFELYTFIAAFVVFLVCMQLTTKYFPDLSIFKYVFISLVLIGSTYYEKARDKSISR